MEENGSAVHNPRIRQVLDGMTTNQLVELVQNIEFTRQRYLQMFNDRRRNVEQECGYVQTGEITAEKYKEIYDRDPIAARTVNILPDGCWQVIPNLYETEDETETEFEKAWNDLGDQLNGGSKWREENNHPIWNYLHRADIMSGIGRYGVILLGTDDGEELTLELEPREGMKLNYLRVLDESAAKISASETDTTNPRFGRPNTYNVSISVPSQLIEKIEQTRNVHWTRLVHIPSDTLQSDEVLALSRLQQPYNRLYDLHKLFGGSGEGYWQGAFPGISFETHPQLGGDVNIDIKRVRDQLEQYFTGLQRFFAIPGMTANSLSPQVVDPSPQIERCIEAICIVIDVPKRIFMGSERGELASSQDERKWVKRCAGRQASHVTPRIIVPFIDHLINFGLLPEPKEYHVDWPDISITTDKEEVDVASGRATTMSTYVKSGLSQLISEKDFLTRVMHFESDEADEILKNRDAEFDKQAQELAMFGMGAEQQVLPFGQQQEQEDDEEFFGEAVGNQAKIREYCSTQLMIPEPLASFIRGVAAKINSNDLHEKGVENETHVTVQYGIHEESFGPALWEAVGATKPVEVKFGPTRHFETPDYDVVYVSLTGVGLRNLRNKIRKVTEYTDSYANYVPHITVAYVKKGTGQKYDGIEPLPNMRATLSQFVFTNKLGQQFTIELGWSLKMKDRLAVEKLLNAFCPTGEGGGTDNSCPPGAGTKRMLKGFGSKVASVKQPGKSKYSPRSEAEAASGSYKSAVSAAKAHEREIKKLESEFEKVTEPKDQLSRLNNLEFKHQQAANHHKLASSLTKDGNQVKFHTARVSYHNRRAKNYFEAYKDMREQLLKHGIRISNEELCDSSSS